MAPLFLAGDILVHRTHHTITRNMVIDAFVYLLGDGCIKDIHMWPRKDRCTREDYWKTVIEFSKQDYSGHPAEENVRRMNEQLKSSGELHVYLREVSSINNILKCVMDQKIVRRNGQIVPDLFRGRRARE